MPLYGQVVLGPPGSGKTTYCNGMEQYLGLLGRTVAVINLDPANESIASSLSAEPQHDDDSATILPYKATLDVCSEIVNLSEVMEQLNLGPNGGLVYCMEYLEAHVDELIRMIRERTQDDSYLLFDLPGQLELYTHGTCVQRIMQALTKAFDLRLCAVQLVDATYCLEATKFLSATLLSTTTMLRLELPSISVLSKMDLLAQAEQSLAFQLEYYLECQDLERLVDFLEDGFGGDAADCDGINFEDNYADDAEYQAARQKRASSKFFQKHRKLHLALAEVVDDFGLLSFYPLDISNAESVGRIVAQVDKCNGYVLKTASTISVQEDVFQCAIQSESASSRYEHVADIQERLSSNLSTGPRKQGSRRTPTTSNTMKHR